MLMIHKDTNYGRFAFYTNEKRDHTKKAVPDQAKSYKI